MMTKLTPKTHKKIVSKRKKISEWEPVNGFQCPHCGEIQLAEDADEDCPHCGKHARLDYLHY